MLHLLTFVPQDSAAIDTLSTAYSDKWDAAAQMDQSGSLMKAAASHDLIFIVLGVSLIIWFILLFFIIRTDRKVSALEETLNHKSNQSTSWNPK